MTIDDKAIGQGRRPRILYLARRWVNAGRALLEEITREYGVTPGDYSLLTYIERLGPCSAADIARAVRITPQAATQQVAQLEAKGMVSRQENSANRRITLIELTPAGEAAFRAIEVRAEALEARLTASLDDDQLALIHAFLSKRPEPGEDETA